MSKSRDRSTSRVHSSAKRQSRNRRFLVETLEGRVLLAGDITVEAGVAGSITSFSLGGGVNDTLLAQISAPSNHNNFFIDPSAFATLVPDGSNHLLAANGFIYFLSTTGPAAETINLPQSVDMTVQAGNDIIFETSIKFSGSLTFNSGVAGDPSDRDTNGASDINVLNASGQTGLIGTGTSAALTLNGQATGTNALPGPDLIGQGSGNATLLQAQNVVLDGQGNQTNPAGVEISQASRVISLGTCMINGVGYQGAAPSGGFGANPLSGVEITDANTILLSQGDLDIEGQGSQVPGLPSTGVSIVAGAHITAEGNSALIHGVGGGDGSTASGSDGVDINGANTVVGINNNDTALTVQGTGGISGSSNIGVVVEAGANVGASGAAELFLIGNGGNGSGGGNLGVEITGSGTLVSSNSAAAPMSITGTGASTLGSENYGVFVVAGAEVEDTGTGGLTITGTGGTGNSASTFEVGVNVTGAQTEIQSSTDVKIKGTGGNNGSDSYGVAFFSGAIVNVSGTANLLVKGTSGNGINNNDGVVVSDHPTNLISPDGNVNIVGTGNGSGTGNDGIFGSNGAEIRSTGAGFVSLYASAPSQSPAIVLSGATGGCGLSTGSGSIFLTGNQIDLGPAGSVQTTSGQVFSFQPYSSNYTTALGGGDTANELVLTDANIAAVSNTFGEWDIGNPSNDSTTSGPLVTNTNTTFGDNVTLFGSQITIRDTINDSNSSLGLNAVESIIQGTSGLLQAKALGLQAAVLAIGTSNAPILTQTSTLAANTQTGGIFVSNTGPLAIGGGVNIGQIGQKGVQTTTSGDISIVNDNSITIGTKGDVIKGGNVFLNASSGDIQTKSNDPNNDITANDELQIMARDILVGSSAGAGATGSLKADFMLLEAGRNVSVQGGSTLVTTDISEPLDLISVNGGAINIGKAVLVSNSSIGFLGKVTLSPATTVKVVLDPTQANAPIEVGNGGSTINLGGANLAATTRTTLPPGNTITLIKNDGNEPIVGTFSQGNSVTVGGKTYRISYTGGDGNDAVLSNSRPVTVSLVKLHVGGKKSKKQLLFIVVRYSDTGELKSSTQSPFQAPKFTQIHFTTADKNGDGVIDTVILSGKKGKKLLTSTLTV